MSDVTIPLTGGGTTLLDQADAEWASQWKWRLSNGYVVRNTGWKKLYLHRELMGLAPGDPLTVDHINRVRTDNRRDNLRTCTRAENRQNLSPSSDGASGARGVHWDTVRGKWIVRCTVNGKKHYAGHFEDLDEAREAAVALRARVMTHDVSSRAGVRK
jgi:hypothetical protein